MIENVNEESQARKKVSTAFQENLSQIPLQANIFSICLRILKAEEFHNEIFLSLKSFDRHRANSNFCCEIFRVNETVIDAKFSRDYFQNKLPLLEIQGNKKQIFDHQLSLIWITKRIVQLSIVEAQFIPRSSMQIFELGSNLIRLT